MSLFWNCQQLSPWLRFSGPAQALQWAESLPTAQEIRFARRSAGLVLAETDPALGAQVILQHHDLRRALDATELHVLQLWAGSNAAEALAWTQGLPQWEIRHAALQSVCESWIKADAAAAFAWIGTAEKEVKTEVIAAMVDALAGIPDPTRDGFLDQAEPAMREEIELRLAEVIGSSIEPPDEDPEDGGNDQSANPHEAAGDDFTQPLRPLETTTPQ